MEDGARPGRLGRRVVRVGQLPGPLPAALQLRDRLDPNDNTAAFRADATFYRVAGLADGGLDVVPVLQLPDRYLRHANYVLRIDPDQHGFDDRQDATFRVTS